MNNKQFQQNAISHKELNDFLIKAKKDNFSINSSENNQIIEFLIFFYFIIFRGVE